MHTESQLRRRAHANGLRLVKYRESSRWYQQYGPYALVDPSNAIVAHGMTLEEVGREL